MIRSIRGRLFTTYLLLVLAALGLTGTAFVYITESTSRERLDDSLAAQASSMAGFLQELATSPGDARQVLELYAQAAQPPRGVRWVALEPSGRALMDPWGQAASIPPERQREAVSGPVVWSAGSGAAEIRHRTVALRLRGKDVGYADVSSDMREVASAVARVKTVVMEVGVALLLLAAILAFWIVRSILAPVSLVRDTAAKMAAGNLQLRVPRMGDDELAQLGETINRLADEIQRNIYGIVGEKDKMDAIMSSMVDGVVTVSPEGTITFVNQMAGRILGGTEEELPPLPGRSLPELLAPAPVSELLETCRTAGTISREMSLGDRLFVVFGIPLGPADTGAETLILLRDVTSLRQLERARSQFLGNVSHELKTPLTIIKGFVITLLKSPGILDEWKRYLDFIDRETDRLSRLVDDLLNLARLRSKKTQMNFTFCEPGELLRETFRQLQAQAAKYDTVLALDCPTNLPVLLADPDRIKEVVINLVDNALKYTPPKGRVELAASATPEHLQIRVRDYGPGIPEEEVPFLFERFFRGTDKGGRKTGGTGIGLAIVKEIVDAHRGRITVESREGEGTTFNVALPLRQKGRRAEPTTDGSLTGAPAYPAPSPPLQAGDVRSAGS